LFSVNVAVLPIFFRNKAMPKFLLSFLAFFLFSNLAHAGFGCASSTVGDTVICAVDNGKSNIELVAIGCIVIASVFTAVSLITHILKR
jgi:hypothetical protein